MTRFLVLGAGFVAEPLVEYLNRKKINSITVAGFTLEEAENLANKFSQVNAIQLDVTDKTELFTHIANFDVVVSLVPAPLHPLIAKVCIECQVHLVTASYQSDAMTKLNQEAKKSGIIILNEIGLDPGIDHLSAMDIIDKSHAEGEEIESFVSWCGGIPAPDNNDNPLSYKFSWEPRGAIMVLLNDAIYQHDRKVIKVTGEDLMSWATPINISDLSLECYPNRESVSYKNIYGITSVKDIIRGTLRYQGFCSIFQAIKELGLMQTDPVTIAKNTSWKEYILQLNAIESLDLLQKKIKPKTWQALQWLGIFSSELNVPEKTTNIDALCALLLQKLRYQDKEKDMVVLQHKFIIKKSDGSRQFVSSTLKQIGDPNGYSAMAKTVGYPAAMAAQLIGENKINSYGMLRPVSQEIYQPILKQLAQEGIVFEEQSWSDTEMTRDEFIGELNLR